MDGFCRGLNGLDELADISSQLLNRKFPTLGPIRVSCFVNKKSLLTDGVYRRFLHVEIPRHETFIAF